jgi:hypothetical protein
MEKSPMSMTSTQSRSMAENHKPRNRFQPHDLHLGADSSNDSYKDKLCTLCGRSFSGEMLQTEISFCPACNRHFAALSDDSVKSYISYWLRKCRSGEPINARCAKRLAS